MSLLEAIFNINHYTEQVEQFTVSQKGKRGSKIHTSSKKFLKTDVLSTI